MAAWQGAQIQHIVCLVSAFLKTFWHEDEIGPLGPSIVLLTWYMCGLRGWKLGWLEQCVDQGGYIACVGINIQMESWDRREKSVNTKNLTELTREMNHVFNNDLKNSVCWAADGSFWHLH